MVSVKEHTDAEAEQLRSLIRDWKVDFDAVTSLEDWDDRHLPSRNLFQQILEIQAVKFARYPGDGNIDRTAANKKKIRTRKLQANAYRCRREQDNEAGWINNVASVVFECMDGSEFRWFVPISQYCCILIAIKPIM